MAKKLVVIAAVTNLTDVEFVDDTDLKSQAMIAYPLIVPAISPAGSVVAGKVSAMRTEISDRDLLLSQAQQKTSNIAAMRKDITNIMTSQWAPKIQEAVAEDEGKVEVLLFKVKGKTPPPAPDPESKPVITKIDLNVPGQHTLTLINSITGKKALPAGILRIDIYGQTGGDPPASLAILIQNGGGYLGQAVKGKFVNVFNVVQQGVPEYYIAVYVGSKTKKPFSQSLMEKANIG